MKIDSNNRVFTPNTEEQRNLCSNQRKWILFVLMNSALNSAMQISHTAWCDQCQQGNSNLERIIEKKDTNHLNKIN